MANNSKTATDHVNASQPAKANNLVTVTSSVNGEAWVLSWDRSDDNPDITLVIKGANKKPENILAPMNGKVRWFVHKSIKGNARVTVKSYQKNADGTSTIIFDKRRNHSDIAAIMAQAE